MKKVVILITLFFSMLILTSCKKGYPTMFFFDQDNYLADTRMEQLFNALEQYDKKNIKEFFSKTAINKSENIDDSIDDLFLFIEGKVISWKRNESPIVFDTSENGNKTKQIITWYSLHTDEQQYLLLLVDYPIDTISPDNVGLYSLVVLKSEDEEKLTGTLEEWIIPGIYFWE